MLLPELCVVRAPDGTGAAFVGIIVDGPTGESMTTSVYSSWPLVLLFLVAAIYYLLRIARRTG
jgi:hypothetical protein